MRHSFETIVKRTTIYALYRYFADRYKRRFTYSQFWEWSGEDQKRIDFYRQFVTKGDLIFDVGANRGSRAKIFSKLGAIVVAVEPQTECSDFLQYVFRNKDNFNLVKKALGASVGQTEMLISNADTISSLSPEWVSAVKESGRFAGHEWNRKETVLVDTLDNLIAQYGRPAFVKIDVEGFEAQVLSGLTTPVGALSVEFTPEFMGNTLKCIEELDRIGVFQFQISLGESMEFSLPYWVNEEEIRRALSKIPSDVYGDLYARLKERKISDKKVLITEI
ncbi:MAG: FkbM family methyltransferase [bacterium]|nr:FkbM family methyltransferase [bacterium]